jgi:hypothetical protein
MQQSDEVFLRQINDPNVDAAVRKVAEVLMKRPGVFVTIPEKRVRPSFAGRGRYRDPGDILLTGALEGRVEVKTLTYWHGAEPDWRGTMIVDDISLVDRGDVEPWLAYALVNGDLSHYCWLTQSDRQHFIEAVNKYDKPIYRMPLNKVTHWRAF